MFHALTTRDDYSLKLNLLYAESSLAPLPACILLIINPSHSIYLLFIYFQFPIDVINICVLIYKYNNYLHRLDCLHWNLRRTHETPPCWGAPWPHTRERGTSGHYTNKNTKWSQIKHVVTTKYNDKLTTSQYRVDGLKKAGKVGWKWREKEKNKRNNKWSMNRSIPVK